MDEISNNRNTEENGVISLLDEPTLTLIASEQTIVDIPAALRELIENSIDAKSTKIYVDYSTLNDTLSELRVVDNGVGIESSLLLKLGDRLISTKRKNSVSLGYRGEALCFITKNSDMTIHTSTGYLGYSLSFTKGSRGELVTMQRGKGTTVVLSNFFSQNKTRRKISSTVQNQNKIEDLCWAYSILHPTIKFRFVVDKVERYSSPRLADHKNEKSWILDQLAFKYGDQYINFADLIHKTYELEQFGINVSLTLSRLNSIRDNKLIFIGVNGRQIHSHLITVSCRAAYLEMARELNIRANSYIAIINIDTAPVETDTCSKKLNVTLYHEEYLAGFLKNEIRINLQNIMNKRSFLEGEEPSLGRRNLDWQNSRESDYSQYILEKSQEIGQNQNNMTSKIDQNQKLISDYCSNQDKNFEKKGNFLSQTERGNIEQFGVEIDIVDGIDQDRDIYGPIPVEISNQIFEKIGKNFNKNFQEIENSTKFFKNLKYIHTLKGSQVLIEYKELLCKADIILIIQQCLVSHLINTPLLQISHLETSVDFYSKFRKILKKMEKMKMIEFKKLSLEKVLDKLHLLMIQNSELITIFGAKISKNDKIKIKKMEFLDFFKYYDFHFYSFLVVICLHGIKELTECLEILAISFSLNFKQYSSQEGKGVKKVVDDYLERLVDRVANRGCLIEIDLKNFLEPLIDRKELVKKFERC